MMKYLVVTVALAFAACQTPTPYQPAVAGHGYWEEQTGDDTYRVVFAGNAVTPFDIVEDYLILRSAELAIENGYDRFFFLQSRIDELPARDRRERETCAYSPYFYPYFPYVVEDGSSQYTATAHISLTQDDTGPDGKPTIRAMDVVAGLNGCL